MPTPWTCGNRRTASLAWACAALLPALCVIQGACNRGKRHGSASSSGQAANATPIDLTRLASDPSTQQRVLRLTFAEVADRLGALQLEAKTRFFFSRGGQDYEQNDVYALTRDAQGNVHVMLDTPGSQLELYLMPSTLYVRHDRGRLRRKPRRHLDTESWCDLALAALAQTLEPFGHRVRFTEPKAEKVIGRDALRVRLTLAAERAQNEDPAKRAGRMPRVAPPSLPISALARWRELARPLDLEGQLWIDSLTAVVLRAEIRGRLEVADRRVRPTQLSLDYDSAITAVGDVPAITPPERSVAELEREPSSRDLLGFFRAHLEPSPDEPSRQTP